MYETKFYHSNAFSPIMYYTVLVTNIVAKKLWVTMWDKHNIIISLTKNIYFCPQKKQEHKTISADSEQTLVHIGLYV